MDGTGYKWKEEKKYITVEPNQTAESYVSKQRRVYGIISACSAMVLLGYLAVWIRKRKRYD